MKTFFLFICALAASVYLYRAGVEEFAAYERRQKEAELWREEMKARTKRGLLMHCKQTYGNSAELNEDNVCCRTNMYSLKCEALSR